MDTLSDGGFSGATAGSAIKQTVTANAGDILSFRFNFLTNENTPEDTYNDFAFVSVVGSDTNDLIELVDTKVPVFAASGSSYSQSTGYITFHYVFTSSGTFDIGFGVTDVQDTVFDSALLLDGIEII